MPACLLQSGMPVSNPIQVRFDALLLLMCLLLYVCICRLHVLACCNAASFTSISAVKLDLAAGRFVVDHTLAGMFHAEQSQLHNCLTACISLISSSAQLQQRNLPDPPCAST